MKYYPGYLDSVISPVSGESSVDIVITLDGAVSGSGNTASPIFTTFNPILDVDGDSQQFYYNAAFPTSAFNLSNNFVPTVPQPSINFLEFSNANNAGYAFLQQTSSTETQGDFSLQQFTGGTIPGTSIFSVNESTGNFIFSLQGGALQLNNGSSVTPLEFYNASGTHYAALVAGALTSNVTWTLPLTDSTGTQALVSNGSGILSWSSMSTGTVTSVTGTAFQIDVANPTTTPVISIDSGYLGQTSITTLGNITTGTWGATTIAVNYGGTGNTTFTPYSVICAGTTATGVFQNVVGVGTLGQVLTSAGASALPAWITPTSGTVTSVSGTVNEITVTSPTTTPVISIASTYAGQTSITTLGTIGTGSWAASLIPLQYGGTSANLTASNGGIFYSTASAGAILAGTATADRVLLSGASTTPAWSTATYPSTTTINQLLYSSSANTIAGLATANSSILVTSGTGVPSLSTTLPFTLPVSSGGTGNTTFTAYSVICAGTTATGIFQNVVGVGSSGQVLTSAGASALPSWQTPTSGTVTSVSGTVNEITVTSPTTTPVISIASTYVGQTSITTLGTVTSGTWNASIIPLQYGGTSANLTASNGGIFYSTASAGAILAGTATADRVLLSGASTSPIWSTATYPVSTTINQILYSSSANTIAGLATTNQAVLTTGTTGIPVLTSLALNGEIIIGSTAGAPAAATLSAGAGISITNGSNSITIAATSGGFTWTNVTGSTQALLAENGYITDNSGGVTYTLPASGSLGDEIKIMGKLGISTIDQNANQQILIATASSTVGTGGSVNGNNLGDCITLICITSGTSSVWRAESSIGNWTVT